MEVKEFIAGLGAFVGVMLSWIGSLEWRLRNKVNKNHFDDSITGVHNRINELKGDMKEEFRELKKMIREK